MQYFFDLISKNILTIKNKVYICIMTREKIGDLVYKERRKKKWSYYKLWKESGVVAHQIKSIEQANSDYTFCTLLKVMNALELDIFK